jgi:hypothetical protein
MPLMKGKTAIESQRRLFTSSGFMGSMQEAEQIFCDRNVSSGKGAK